MKLVLIGIQGAGKSTQGNLLSKQLNIPYLSTGHIFRELAKEKTALGRYIKETINAGILVPDSKVIEIVNNYLSRSEYRHGYILDGYPRTIKQAKEFKNNIDKVIYIKIPDKEAIYRLVYRNDKTRADETLPALKNRLQAFHKYTEPVIGFFRRQKKLVEIDGTKSIRQVNKEILKSLGKQLIKNQIRTWERREPVIMAIVGLAGAGKTEAAHYFRNKGLPIVSFGKYVNDYVDKHHLPHIEEVHKKIREELREKYGKEALAVLNVDKIREAFKKNKLVVIDGLYSWEEYIYLKKQFPKTKIYLIAIYADKALRYKRIKQRKYRSKLYGEQRDINQLLGTNQGPAIAFADFLVKNNFSREEFYDKLEHVYRTIYFS